MGQTFPMKYTYKKAAVQGNLEGCNLISEKGTKKNVMSYLFKGPSKNSALQGNLEGRNLINEEETKKNVDKYL